MGAAAAQTHPFAVGAREAPAAAGGWLGWIVAQQGAFYAALTGAVRAAAVEPAAFWTLAGLSFAYGVFHAAGPGHGKAVVAAYMVANERTLKRGLIITALAAALQAAIAIAIVGASALVFNATAQRMTQTALAIETVAYGVMVVLGAWLVWRKSHAVVRALAALRAAPAAGPSGRFVCDPVGPQTPGGCPQCGMAHAPDPARLEGPFSMTAAAATVVAAGARPCSGALLVLVFALSQGAFGVGVGAASAMALGVATTTGALAAVAVFGKSLAARLAGGSGRGVLILRAGEWVAAMSVLGVGLLLLAGAAAGRALG